MKITTTTTRLWVTSSWYLRWSWTAKNLSTLTATTPRKEIVENTEPEIFMMRLSVTASDVWNGWANKPTPKSEKAKLKSRVFKVFFIVEFLCIAQIVTKFTVIVVYVKKLLKIQLAIKVERRSLSSVCSGKYCEDSLQFNSFMMLTHLSWMQGGNFVNFTGVISTCFPDWLFFLLKIFLFPIPGINKKEAVAFFLGSGVVCGDFVKSACATYAHLAQ